MAVTASSLLTAFLLLPAAALGAQPAPVTRPAPPLRPSPVEPAHEITIYRDRNYNGPAVSIPHDEALHLPSQLDNGRCTDAQFPTAGRRNPSSVEVTAASIGVARGRIRVEGR